jgi:hypothetical protein
MSDPVLIVAVHVDDLTLVCESSALLASVKVHLRSHFNMEDLGEITNLLGIAVSYSRAQRTLRFSHSSYLTSVLDRFSMHTSNPQSTPMDPKADISVPDSPPLDSDVPLRSAVGALLYSAAKVRPDLSYATGIIARHQDAPLVQHWNAVKRVLRYVRGHLDRALVYVANVACNEDSGFSLDAHVDADFASEKVSRKSTTGFVISFCGMAIRWVSRKQRVVALSSTEAEYIALSDMCSDLLWLRSILGELQVPLRISLVHEDNEACAHLAKDPVSIGRSKHIDVRHHFVRDLVADNVISLVPIPTADQPADMLTKPLAADKFNKHCAAFNLR